MFKRANQKPKMRSASVSSMPAPVGGLNTRDNIAAMKPQFAVTLENWWPEPSVVSVRRGFIEHASGLPGSVDTLVEYLPASGTRKLFAASEAGIYDVTASGAVGAAVVSGLTSVRFQTQGITTPGGSFMYLVNGADAPQLFNGTTWTAITGASTPAITGVTTTSLVHVTLFKNRLFFVEKDSLRFWYLPVNSIGGAASQFDLGSVFRLGGSIMAMYPWTIDAGSGADDHLAIITTNGEVAVYRGTDPNSAADWALIGVFVLGRPISRRCGIKYGGDLAVMTTEGLFPLGKGLLSASVDRRVALSDNIQSLISREAFLFASFFGWDLALYPDANMLILNVPAGSVAHQYAMNTITGAWTKFTGMNAKCWLNTSVGLFFGDAGVVRKAWTGRLDLTAPITAKLDQAFSVFGSGAQKKYFTLIKPYLLTDGRPSISYGLNLDYSTISVPGSLPSIPFQIMQWGSMVWGSMVWGGDLRNISGWATVGGIGNSASLKLNVSNNGSDVRLSNTDFVFSVGGIL